MSCPSGVVPSRPRRARIRRLFFVAAVLAPIPPSAARDVSASRDYLSRIARKPPPNEDPEPGGVLSSRPIGLGGWPSGGTAWDHRGLEWGAPPAPYQQEPYYGSTSAHIPPSSYTTIGSYPSSSDAVSQTLDDLLHSEDTSSSLLQAQAAIQTDKMTEYESVVSKYLVKNCRHHSPPTDLAQLGYTTSYGEITLGDVYGFPRKVPHHRVKFRVKEKSMLTVSIEAEPSAQEIWGPDKHVMWERGTRRVGGCTTSGEGDQCCYEVCEDVNVVMRWGVMRWGVSTSEDVIASWGGRPRHYDEFRSCSFGNTPR